MSTSSDSQEKAARIRLRAQELADSGKMADIPDESQVLGALADGILTLAEIDEDTLHRCIQMFGADAVVEAVLQSDQQSSERRWTRQDISSDARSTALRFVPHWTWAIAATAVLFLVVGNTWFWIKGKRLESQLQETQHKNVALEAHTRVLEQQVKEATQRLDQQADALLALQQQPFVERFAPDSITRQHGQSNLLKIGSTKDLIEFQLRLERSSYQRYVVTLETANGDPVLKTNGLPAERAVSGEKNIKFLVPARLLQPRDYVVSVNGMIGNGQSGEIEAYNFRVSKKQTSKPPASK